MTTLATGTRNSGTTEGGFSLLELLVTLLIIGITVSMINLSGANLRPRETRREATRLTALLQLAQQEAVLTGFDLALHITTSGYTFLRQDDDGRWQIIPKDDETLRPRTLPRGMTINATIEGEAVMPDSGEFTATGGTTAPHLVLFASGEVTPFSLALEDQYSSTLTTITSTYPGKIVLAPPPDNNLNP